MADGFGRDGKIFRMVCCIRLFWVYIMITTSKPKSWRSPMVIRVVVEKNGVKNDVKVFKKHENAQKFIDNEIRNFTGTGRPTDLSTTIDLHTGVRTFREAYDGGQELIITTYENNVHYN